MALARITGQGLTAIALLVALLWACLVGEHVIVRNANQVAWRALYENHVMQMRRQAQPVRVPTPVPQPANPNLG